MLTDHNRWPSQVPSDPDYSMLLWFEVGKIRDTFYKREQIQVFFALFLRESFSWFVIERCWSAVEEFTFYMLFSLTLVAFYMSKPFKHYKNWSKLYMVIHRINWMDQVQFMKVGILSSQWPGDIMPPICHIYDASLSPDRSWERALYYVLSFANAFFCYKFTVCGLSWT